MPRLTLLPLTNDLKQPWLVTNICNSRDGTVQRLGSKLSDRRIDVKMHCSIPSILPAFNALFIYKKRVKITGLSNVLCASS